MTPTPAFDRQVLALAEQGLLEREIADRLGVTRSRVRNAKGRLRAAGCRYFESRYKEQIKTREAQIATWDAEGVSQAEIARRIGVSPVRAHQIVHRIRNRSA